MFMKFFLVGSREVLLNEDFLTSGNQPIEIKSNEVLQSLFIPFLEEVSTVSDVSVRPVKCLKVAIDHSAGSNTHLSFIKICNVLGSYVYELFETTITRTSFDF